MQSTVESAILIFIVGLAILTGILRRLGFRRVLLLVVPIGLVALMVGIIGLVKLPAPLFMGRHFPDHVTNSGPSTPPQSVTKAGPSTAPQPITKPSP